MDGQKVRTISLQKTLILWIIIITLIISIVAGLSAGVMAFIDARQTQDEVLSQIADLLVDKKLPSSSAAIGKHYDLMDSKIIVQSLSSPGSGPLSVPLDKADGFATLELNDISWRTFTLSGENKSKVFVAQQTDLRDELAWSNLISAVLPISLLSLSLLILLPWLIRHKMKVIVQLSNKLDRQSVDDINPLPTEKIPQELFPFVEAINRLLNRTRLAIEQQRRFITDASHELRTPVTALSLLSENLQAASTSPEEKDKRFQLMRKGLDRLNALVDQLLNLARLQSTPGEVNEVVAMNEIVEEVVVLFYPLAEKKEIDLGVLDLEEVFLDDINSGLKQIVENSISNAIYYTPENGKIDISLKRINNKAIFVVADNGPGIDQCDLEKVFTPFYRGSDTSRQGNGLGLAICQEIAQRLNGKINLRNRSVRGLEFRYEQNVSEC